MFSTSTFASIWSGAVGDTTYMVAIVCSATVIGIVALAGLGFGIRHLLRKITGRKF